MSKVGFPLKDLWRRRFHTFVTILALTFCVASMVSTVIVAQNFGLHITAVLAGRLNVGFVNIFSGFATTVTYLSILTGGLMAYFFVSANMRVRVRDIGIMKAAGCIPDQAFGYFAVELFLLVFLSCVAGTGVGVLLSYLGYYFRAGGLFGSPMSIDILTILEVLLVFMVVSHLFGIQPIVRALREKPAETLFPYYLRDVSFKSGHAFLSKMGVSFRIAYRALMRRKNVTLSTIVCLSTALASATVAVVGAPIANYATQMYICRGIGENVIAIGHEDITAQYMHFLSQLSYREAKDAIDYLDSRYVIPQTTVSRLSAISDVTIEPRLMQEATVFERPAIVIIDMQYFSIGNHRSREAIVFGVDPSLMISEWFVEGRTLNRTDVYGAVLGDSLASGILASPFDQEVTIFQKDFNILGIAIDPINNGLVAYVPVNALTGISNQVDYNIILLKVDRLALPRVLNEVREILEGTGLSFVELNQVLLEYQAFFGSLWSLFTVMSLFFLATVALCLFTYMALFVDEQEPEIAMMRALGAKTGRIVSIVMLQAVLVVLTGGTIGVLIGLVSSFAFLVPSAAIFPSDFALVVTGLLMAVGFLCVTSLYPALRVAKRPLAKIMPKM